jgi:hypothetical protein
MSAGVYGNSSYNFSDSAADTTTNQAGGAGYQSSDTWADTNSTKETGTGTSGTQQEAAGSTFSYLVRGSGATGTNSMQASPGVTLPGAAVAFAAPDATTVPVAGAGQAGSGPAIAAGTAPDAAMVASFGAPQAGSWMAAGTGVLPEITIVPLDGANPGGVTSAPVAASPDMTVVGTTQTWLTTQAQQAWQATGQGASRAAGQAPGPAASPTGARAAHPVQASPSPAAAVGGAAPAPGGGSAGNGPTDAGSGTPGEDTAPTWWQSLLNNPYVQMYGEHNNYLGVWQDYQNGKLTLDHALGRVTGVEMAVEFLARNSIDDHNEYTGVGQPGMAESFIPVWGSLRASFDDFQHERYVWGSVNAGLAVLDLVGVGETIHGLSAFGKAALKVGLKTAARDAVVHFWEDSVVATVRDASSLWEGLVSRVSGAGEWLAGPGREGAEALISRITGAGRNGGEIIPREELSPIGEWLARKYKVFLNPLKSETAASEFSVAVTATVKEGHVYYLPKSTVPVLNLRNNATYAEFWHELMHVLEYTERGAESFVNLPAKAREELAFERFVKTPMWESISTKERQFLWDYLVDFWQGNASIPRPTQ